MAAVPGAEVLLLAQRECPKAAALALGCSAGGSTGGL